MKLYKSNVMSPTEVLEKLEKGRKGLPDGTIRDYNGMKYKKVGGKWEYLGKQASTKGERKKGPSPDKVADGASSVDIEPRVGLKTPVGEIVAEKNGMWAIRPNDGKIGGSLQLMSTQDLKEEIFLAERRNASATKEMKQQESDRKAKEARDDTRGFLDSMSSMDRGRAQKHLFDRSTMLDGKVYRNKEFVEELANRGLVFDMKEIAYGDSGKKKMRYIARTEDGKRFYDISKTQYSYGKHLSTKKDRKKGSSTDDGGASKKEVVTIRGSKWTKMDAKEQAEEVKHYEERLASWEDDLKRHMPNTKNYRQVEKQVKHYRKRLDMAKKGLRPYSSVTDGDAVEKSTKHRLHFGGTDMETRKVYSATELRKAQQDQLVEVLEKGRKLPDGSVRTWGGQKYRKEGGKWKPVSDGGDDKHLRSKNENDSSSGERKYKDRQKTSSGTIVAARKHQGKWLYVIKDSEDAMTVMQEDDIKP